MHDHAVHHWCTCVPDHRTLRWPHFLDDGPSGTEASAFVRQLARQRRQICWAHLLRKFVSFAERDGPVGRFGRELLDYAGMLFELLSRGAGHHHRSGARQPGAVARRRR